MNLQWIVGILVLLNVAEAHVAIIYSGDDSSESLLINQLTNKSKNKTVLVNLSELSDAQAVLYKGIVSIMFRKLCNKGGKIGNHYV